MEMVDDMVWVFGLASNQQRSKTDRPQQQQITKHAENKKETSNGWTHSIVEFIVFHFYGRKHVI